MKSKQPAAKGQPQKGWLSPLEAAEFVSLHVDTIYDACATGGLKHSRLTRRGKIRIKVEWLDEWMESHARKNQF